MKTTNNAQKTVKVQIRKMVLHGAAVIVSLVLISWSVGAQSYLEQVLNGYNFGEMAMTGIEETQETSEANATIHAIEAAHVIESNSALTNFEAIEAELELQVEEYRAADFIETELSSETEKWMNTTQINFEAIEAELELQVEKYNAAKYVKAELSTEAENWTNRNTDIDLDAIEAGLTNQIEKYNATHYVEAELSFEAATLMTEKEYMNKVEVETAMEADQQIEKYAMQQISQASNYSK